MLQVVFNGLALVGQDQPRLVQRISAKHAAHGIGDQFADGVGQQQGFQLFLALVVIIAIMRVTGQSDLVEWHLGC